MRNRSNIDKGLGGQTAGIALLNVFAALSSFVTHLLLARNMGATEYGRLAYSLSWVWLLSGLVMASPDKILVRYIATHAARSEWSALCGLLRWSRRFVWRVAAFVVALLIAIGAVVPAHVMSASTRQMLWAAGGLAIAVILLRTGQAALRGLNLVMLSQFIEAGIQPLALFAGVAVMVARCRLTAPYALTFYALAAGIALIAALRLLRRRIPLEVRTAAPHYEIPTWLAAAPPLLLVGGLNLVNEQFDVLLLGALHGPQAVSLYAVARRGACLIPFALSAANQALAPTFARLHAQGETERLQQVVTHSARRVLLVATLIACAMLLGSGRFLGLFGVAFVEGRTALMILIVGQWINAAFGSVATLLLMTGHERDAVWGMGVSTALNCLLNILLVPRYGIVGAAIAAAVSTALWNLLLAYRVRSRLGLSTTALGC